MGALDRLLKGRLEDIDLQARAEGKAEGRAEERHRIKEYLTSIGISPDDFDKYTEK